MVSRKSNAGGAICTTRCASTDNTDFVRKPRYLNPISGATDYNDPAYQPVAGHSLNGELYYRFRPVSWLELQPGLQYWHRPGGVAQTQDAWVVEWKTVVTF